MKGNNQWNRRGQGYALVSVMVIIVTLSVLVGVMYSAGMQRAFMARKLANRTRALAVAEMGISRAYETLSGNFNLRTNPAAFPPGTNGGGNYILTVTPVSNHMALVSASGTFQDVTVEVRADVTRHLQGQDIFAAWDPDPFRTLIFAGKSIKWKLEAKKPGDLDVSGARMHSNNRVVVEGENVTLAADATAVNVIELKKACTLQGNVRAPTVKIEASCAVNGTVTRDKVPRMTMPQIDLLPYYLEAVRNGQVVNKDIKIGDKEFVDIAPPGGVLWINGKLEIEGQGLIDGCIIAVKSIKINGSVVQTRYADFPALVSRDGKIEVKELGVYHGLVYAPKGSVKFQKSVKPLKMKSLKYLRNLKSLKNLTNLKSGKVRNIVQTVIPTNGFFTGGIITGKKLEGEGPWTFMFWEDTTPGYPDGTQLHESYEVVYISAWHK